MAQDPAPIEKRDRIAPGFARRLSYYLFGIAMGLLMLGLISQARSRARATQSQPQTPPAEPAGEAPRAP